MASRSTRVRLVVSVLATVVILTPLAWLWQSSLVGKSYSVMGMGTLDYGGGPVAGHAHGATDRSVTDFVVDDARKANVRVDLVAEQQNLAIGGRSVAGYTLNVNVPGEVLHEVVGDPAPLLQQMLVNVLLVLHVRPARAEKGLQLLGA